MLTRRKKLVVTVVVLLAAAAVITFARHRIGDAVSFALLPPIEKKLVGEWKTYSIGGVTVTTLRADHNWTSVGGCLDEAPHGRWSVDGSDIIFSFDLPPLDVGPELKPARFPIQELIDNDHRVRSWIDVLSRK